MTIADKLLQVNQVKQDIKTAIEEKGVSMTGVPFTGYPAKIDGIARVVELTQAQYDALSVYDNNTYYLIVDEVVEEGSSGGYHIIFSMVDEATGTFEYAQYFSIDNGTTWTQLTNSRYNLLVDFLDNINTIKFKIRNARIEIDNVVFADRLNNDSEFVTDNYTLTKDVDINVVLGWFD